MHNSSATGWRASSSPSGYAGTPKCQKCLKTDHWTFDCKNDRVYKSRPSRTAILKNPALKPRIVRAEDAQPVVESILQAKKAVANEQDESTRAKKEQLNLDAESDSDSSESEYSEEEQEKKAKREKKGANRK